VSICACLWTIAYRDKKVVGVFVRFRAPLDEAKLPNSAFPNLQLPFNFKRNCFIVF
jgi:hypothetical protein